MTRKGAPVIGITGSCGKSTTKEMLSSILETKWNVLKTPGNKNLPLHIRNTMKQKKRNHQAVVLELGMGKPGAAYRHSKYMQPNIVVYTCIGTAHFGNLGNSVQAIAQNKSMLMRYMKPKGLVLINLDDENSKWINTKLHKGKMKSIGIHNKNADYYASDIRLRKSGIEFVLRLDGKDERFTLKAHGLHNVYNACFAIAVAHALGFTSTEIRRGLKRFSPPIKRLNVHELRADSILIDDTVNANLESMKAGIDVLQVLGEGKKKVAILGSMLELGELTDQAHAAVGEYLAKNEVDSIFTLGQETALIKDGAMKAGMKRDNIHVFKDRYELHEALVNEDLDNSVILVKGSRSMQMHETSEFIKSRYLCYVRLGGRQRLDEALVHPDTLKRLQIPENKFRLRFGQFSKMLALKPSPLIPHDVIQIPQKPSGEVTIPNLDYESYYSSNVLHLGPVIGFSVLPLYYHEPQKQLVRFAHLKRSKGLYYMFLPQQAHATVKTIAGKYYDPKQQKFIDGTFPLPSAIFNRVPLTEKHV